MEGKEKPELILIATGSELQLALAVGEALLAEGRQVRVVSMPCCEVFDAQATEYKNSVLPSDVKARVAVEAGSTDLWRKYVGLSGAVVGIDRFGASAPGAVLYEHFGVNEASIMAECQRLLAQFAY